MAKKDQKSTQESKNKSAKQETKNETPAETQTQPKPKSKAIYWVCGCLTCCAMMALVIILLWSLSFFGIISPGFLPAIFGR